MKQFLVPIFVFLFLTSAFAQDEDAVAKRTRIGKQSSTTSGDRGLFTVPGVETLNKKQFSFGVGFNNMDRTPRDIDINSFPLYVSYGLFGRLTVTGAFELQRQLTARNLAQTGFNSSYPFVADAFAEGFGDTILSAKYRLQRRRDNVGGISLKGFVKLPTADAKKGLGTGATDVGADLIFSSLLPLGFVLHSSMAFTATSDAEAPFSTTAGAKRGLKDEMRSGFGAAWPSSGMNIFGGTLQGIFEYATVTFVGAGSTNAASTRIQNPSDISGGIRFLALDQGITVDAGYRTNSNFDLDFPNNKNRHGYTFNLSYTKPVAVPNLTNHYPLVVLESDSDELARGGTATITAEGFDADNDELQYSWMATGGEITGSGSTAKFNAANLQPGKYTIRATATDGKGGTTVSEIDITIKP